MASKTTRDLLMQPKGCSVSFQELIDAGVLEIGDGYRAKNEEMGQGGPIFLRAGHISDTHISFEGVEHFKPELAEALKPKMAKAGDTIVTTKGNSTGRIAYATGEMPPFVYSPHLSYWRSKDHAVLPPGLLRYWASSTEFIVQLSGMKASTDMAPYLSLTDQRRLRITLPAPEQRPAIAGVLGALDDKIEVNRKTARVLEGIARAVFTSWFVDFDPVRRRAASHPGSAAPLPADLAALFPTRLVDSPIGEVPEIPEGWTASRLTDHFNLTMGQSPPGSTYNETGDGLPFYQGRTDYGFRFPTPRVYCTAPTRFAEPGDTLVSVRAPVGDVNMAIERCAVGRGVAAVRHKSGSRSLTYYAMHALRAHFLRFEADGTVFGAIGKTDFERLPFVAPPPPIVAAFEKFAAPTDHRIEGCERQSATLAALRDALLPKLISGELRIADAEKIVGRAV